MLNFGEGNYISSLYNFNSEFIRRRENYDPTKKKTYLYTSKGFPHIFRYTLTLESERVWPELDRVWELDSNYTKSCVCIESWPKMFSSVFKFLRIN